MICQFTTSINELTSDIIYELHEHNNDYYLVQWKIGKNIHKEKQRKEKVDESIQTGEYRIISK